jgi:hypothetical protein
MTYRCVHVADDTMFTYQLDTFGNEVEIEVAHCANCGRWYYANKEPKEATSK